MNLNSLFVCVSPGDHQGAAEELVDARGIEKHFI